MEKILLIASLYFISPLSITAQANTKCFEEMMAAATTELQKATPDYGFAIYKYRAAQVCNPEKRLVIDGYIDKVNEKILELNALAEKRRLEAQAQKREAEQAKKDADYQKEEAIKQEFINHTAGKGLSAMATANHSFWLLDYAAQKSNYESELALANRDKLWQDYTKLFYEQSFEMPNKTGLKAIAIAPSGHFILGGYNDGIARLWNIKTRSVAWQGAGFEGAISTVAIGRSGIIAIGSEHAIHVYSPENKYSQPSVISFKNATVNSLSISKDETHLAVGFNNKVNATFAAIYDMEAVLAVINKTSMVQLESNRPRPTLSDGEKNLRGHINQVASIAFSPDGQFVATASWDKTAIVWTLDGQPKYQLFGHAAALTTIAYAPNGRFIATSGLDHIVKIWDATTGDLLSNLPSSQDATIRSLAFTADSRLIISTDEAGKIRVQNLNGQIEYELMGHADMVTCVHPNYFDPLSNHVATGDAGGVIRYWNIQARKPKLSEGHQDAVTCARFSSDRQLIVSGSADKTVKLWHTSGQLEQTFKGHYGIIKDVDISADGKYIVSGARDNDAILWSSYGLRIATLAAHRGSVYAVRFMPDQKHILTASSDGKAYIWLREGGKLVDSLIGHGDRLSTAAVTPDGKTILLGGDDGIVSLWQHDGKKWQLNEKYTERTKGLIARKFQAQIAISADGKKWAAQAGDSTAIVYMFGRKGGIKVSTPYSAVISALSFSPTGDSLLVVGSKGEMRIYRLTNTAAKLIASHTHYAIDYDESQSANYHISSAAISPEGNLISTTSNWERVVRLWDTEGSERISMKGTLSEIKNLSWRSNMQQYITIDNRSLTYWDSMGNYIKRQTFDAEITASSFSTQFDSVLLVQDTSARIFDLKKAETVGYLTNNTEKLMLMPDGKKMLTFENSRLRLYKTANTELLITSDKELPVPADGLAYQFAISAKGNFIIAYAGRDSVAILFDDKLRLVNTFSLPKSNRAITAAAISPNEQNCIFADEKGLLYFYQKKSSQILFTRRTMRDKITNIRFLDDDHFTTTDAAHGADTEGGVAVWYMPIEEKKKKLKMEWTTKVMYPLHLFAGTSIFDYRKEGKFLIVSKGRDFDLYPLALAHEKIEHMQSLSILDKAKYGLPFEGDKATCQKTTASDTLAQCIDCVLYHYKSETELKKQKDYLDYAMQYARKLKDSSRIKTIETYTDDLEIIEDNLARQQYGNSLTYYQNRLKYYLKDADSLSLELKKTPNEPSIKRALAQKYISAAYMYIFLDKPADAIRVGEKALSIDPKQTWAKTNIALGYLFSNQLDKAKTIYQTWKDKPWKDSGHNSPEAYESFKGAFLSDFEELKVAGKTHRYMAEIEKILSTPEPILTQKKN